MNQSEIKVSIICNTYNHEKYIEEALKSFLMQETNFNYEILVHDDASTDKTADIVRRYEKEYPDIVRPIYQRENQFSQGQSIDMKFQFPRVRGTYIAYCEGDDYWTDSHKLQKQYDALEAHPEVDICVHNHIEVEAMTGDELVKRWVTRGEERIASQKEVILGEGGFVATNSIFYRVSVYEKDWPFFKMMPYDYTYQILGALQGGMLCLPEFMSVYRFAVPNSACDIKRRDANIQKKFLERKQKMLRQLDIDTEYLYHDAILGRLMLYEVSSENKAVENWKAVIKYKNGFRELSLKKKVSVLANCVCPWLVRVKSELMDRKRKRILKKIQ